MGEVLQGVRVRARPGEDRHIRRLPKRPHARFKNGAAGKPIGKELLISVSGGNYKVFKVERDQWRMSDTRVAAGRVETFKPSTLVIKPQVINPIKGEIEAGYRVIPGPISYKPPSLGATRRYGLSLKIGESSGPFGYALLYNAAPDIQIQGGYLTSDIPIDNPGFEAREYRTNAKAHILRMQDSISRPRHSWSRSAGTSTVTGRPWREWAASASIRMPSSWIWK